VTEPTPIAPAEPAALAATAPMVTRAEPSAPAVDLPPIASALPPDSSLQLVETRFKPAPVIDEPPPPGPRRVRPAKVALAEEPLQLVETSRERPPAS
jgi:hypothetical protein